MEAQHMSDTAVKVLSSEAGAELARVCGMRGQAGVACQAVRTQINDTVIDPSGRSKRCC
jgi:hypothetical protein